MVGIAAESSVLDSPLKDVWPILVPVDELFRHVITFLPEAMFDHVLLDHLRRIVFLCDEKAYFVVGADRSVQRCSVQRRDVVSSGVPGAFGYMRNGVFATPSRVLLQCTDVVRWHALER